MADGVMALTPPDSKTNSEVTPSSHLILQRDGDTKGGIQPGIYI